MCSQLGEYIEEYYTVKELELIISNSHGIRLLYRTNINTQKVLDFIASKDLAFNIYQHLLTERVVSTDEFCQKNVISLSTLQRKTREINAFLNVYDKPISFSNQTFRINRAEATMRSFTYIFLYMMHRQISRVYWLKNHQYYLDLAKKLLYKHIAVNYPVFQANGSMYS